MSDVTGSRRRVPHVMNDDFVSFLEWLAENRGLDVGQIIYVVEKPWKWAPEYREFQAEGEGFTEAELQPLDTTDTLYVCPDCGAHFGEKHKRGCPRRV